jgi:hypothetical protein
VRGEKKIFLEKKYIFGQKATFCLIVEEVDVVLKNV